MAPDATASTVTITPRYGMLFSSGIMASKRTQLPPIAHPRPRGHASPRAASNAWSGGSGMTRARLRSIGSCMPRSCGVRWLADAGRGAGCPGPPRLFFHQHFQPLDACTGDRRARLGFAGHFIPAPVFNEGVALVVIDFLECLQLLLRVRLLHKLGDADRRPRRQDRL